jgi:hypothetical protein
MNNSSLFYKNYLLELTLKNKNNNTLVTKHLKALPEYGKLVGDTSEVNINITGNETSLSTADYNNKFESKLRNFVSNSTNLQKIVSNPF